MMQLNAKTINSRAVGAEHAIAWVLAILTVTVLAYSPAVAAPDRSRPSGTGAGSSVLEESCVEVTSETGRLAVRECLVQSFTKGSDLLTPMTIPSSVRHQIGAELLWMPHLLPTLDRAGEHRGELVRWATLPKDRVISLGSHPFVARVEVQDGLITFRLELEDHKVSSVDGEISNDGDGLLVFTEVGTAEQRTMVFEDGQLVQSADPGIADRSSSFYMGCYIDSPRFDHFHPDICYQFGTGSSVAVFKVFLPYTPSSVVWLTPSSTCSGLYCTSPISARQTVYGYAYWVINGTPTGPVAAQAIFEYEPGL